MTARMLIRHNALFSLVSGSVLVLGAPLLDDWFGVRAWFLVAIGAAVSAFGAILALGAERPGGSRFVLPFAFGADVAWVIGAAALYAGFPAALTRAGWIALAAVSAAVAGFAVAQGRLLRGGRRARQTVTP